MRKRKQQNKLLFQQNESQKRKKAKINKLRTSYPPRSKEPKLPNNLKYIYWATTPISSNHHG